MRILLTGGSACGKSSYAESIAAALPGPRYYIATMRPFGEESWQRIRRHRGMRALKGFDTIERYTDLSRVVLPERGTALLECVCNLAANEMFDEAGAGPARTVSAVLDGIAALERQCDTLLVVTNDVGSDTGGYDPLTMRYVAALGEINAALAARFEQVFELVCGIPLTVKGGLR